MPRKIPEMTPELRTELANRVVENMDLGDMMAYIKDDLEQLYTNSATDFEVDWELHPPAEDPEMKSYDVRVIRISHRELVFNVNAPDPAAARMAASERAFNADFSYGEEIFVEYETNGVRNATV
jgi:hypothetical protein